MIQFIIFFTKKHTHVWHLGSVFYKTRALGKKNIYKV